MERDINIYHCCTQKTASRWFKVFFEHEIFQKYCPLEVSSYQEVRWEDPETPGRIFFALYTDWEHFVKMPKPEKHKFFFMLRDPRDVVVSWYYSVRYSHAVMGQIGDWRKCLSKLPMEAGLKYSIRKLQRMGYFEKQKSWVKNAPKESIFTYEYFCKKQFNFFYWKLFKRLGIEMPKEELSRLLKECSFKAITGRRRGIENRQSNYRKGMPGDWMEHFSVDVYKYFREMTDNVHEELGYE